MVSKTGALKNGLRNSKQKKWFTTFEFKVAESTFETEFRRDEKSYAFLDCKS
jgi:hypothetical protein